MCIYIYDVYMICVCIYIYECIYGLYVYIYTHTQRNIVVLFSPSIVSSSLQSHGLQHIMLPCPSPTPGACSNSCPLSPWCHPTISSSVSPFSSCLQSFPVSGSFPMSQLFTSGGQSVGASASVLPMNIQDSFPFNIDWFDLLAVQRTLKSLLQHHSSKTSVLQCSAFFIVQLSDPFPDRKSVV